MKRVLFIFFAIVLGSHCSDAQNNTTLANVNVDKKIKNTVYFELFGNGGIYSVNYDRRLSNQIWGRIGASYFPVAYEGLATFPVGVSYLFGKHSKFFELGLGTTLFSAGSDDLLFDLDENGGKQFSAGISATVGYRFQPPQEDLFFKAALIPAYIPVSSTFGVSAGLSVGYSF